MFRNRNTFLTRVLSNTVRARARCGPPHGGGHSAPPAAPPPARGAAPPPEPSGSAPCPNRAANAARSFSGEGSQARPPGRAAGPDPQPPPPEGPNRPSPLRMTQGRRTAGLQAPRPEPRTDPRPRAAKTAPGSSQKARKKDRTMFRPSRRRRRRTGVYRASPAKPGDFALHRLHDRTEAR